VLRTERLSRVLDFVYRAAIEPEVWPQALREISDLVDSSVSGLLVQEKRTGAIPLVAMDPRSPQEPLAEYVAYYGAIDELRRHALRHGVGEVIGDSAPDFLAVVRRSVCYHDFYKKWEMEHFVGGAIVNSESSEGTLVVYRGGSAYSEEQFEAIELLLPHVTRAVEIWSRLRMETAKAGTFGGVLDSVRCGVVLVEHDGRIVWMNQAAREMTSAHDGITIEGSMLKLDSSAADGELRRLIRSVRDGAELTRPVKVSVPRLSGFSPYSITAAPLHREADGLPIEAVAMIVIADPVRRAASAEHYLREHYGLTPAEAAVAAAVADGSSLREVAHRRGISFETARAQLKKSLEKTNTHRQTELAHLILTASLLP